MRSWTAWEVRNHNPWIRRGVGRCPARSVGDIAAGQSHDHIRGRLSRFAGIRGTGCALGCHFRDHQRAAAPRGPHLKRSKMSVLAPRVSSFFLQELTTRTTMSYPGGQVTPATPRDPANASPIVACVACIRGVGLAQRRRAARRRKQDHAHEPMGDRRGIVVRGPFRRTTRYRRNRPRCVGCSERCRKASSPARASPHRSRPV